jgi:hypothetical protein
MVLCVKNLGDILSSNDVAPCSVLSDQYITCIPIKRNLEIGFQFSYSLKVRGMTLGIISLSKAQRFAISPDGYRLNAACRYEGTVVAERILPSQLSLDRPSYPQDKEFYTDYSLYLEIGEFPHRSRT